MDLERTAVKQAARRADADAHTAHTLTRRQTVHRRREHSRSQTHTPALSLCNASRAVGRRAVAMAAVAVDVDPRHWGSGERLAGRGHGAVNKAVRAWGEALGRREMDGRNGRIVSRGAPRRAPPAQTIAHTALTLSPLAWLGAPQHRSPLYPTLPCGLSVCAWQSVRRSCSTHSSGHKVCREGGRARCVSVREGTQATQLYPHALAHTHKTQNAPLSPVRGSNPWHLD